MKEVYKKGGFSRREFIKIGGVAAAAAQTGGLVAAGISEGANPESFTGWESSNPSTQFFNRAPFEFMGPAHKPVGKTRRPSHITDYVFGRVAMFQKAYEANPSWKLTDPLEKLGLIKPVELFYKQFPERLEWDFRTFSETIPTNYKDKKKYGNYYKLADAYSAGFQTHGGSLPRPKTPPEKSDFSQFMRGRFHPISEPTPFKSPALATKFIKEMAFKYGASIVGITKTNPNYIYSEGWRGCSKNYDFTNMPKHWEYLIVFGVPMEWDVIQGSPQSSTSYDAYDRVSTTAVRLEGAIKYLGYPARAHAPMTGYDLIVPPHAIEAGLGEVGRTGYCITPEFGGNCRMAAVTTNLPMELDKPIEIGVKRFCDKCKLCAKSCPSGAISMADSSKGMNIRGYEHWYINNGACYNYWRETMGPMGCRLCVATCPFSRKDNWVHKMAREIDPRDPTGIVSSSLLWMQENFFEYPEAVEYRRPPVGRFASYRPEPEYLHAENYLDIKIEKP